MLTALLCLSTLTSCASSPAKLDSFAVEHVPTTVTPPAALMADCPSLPSDGTLGGELQRLADLVRCEWDHNATLRAWAAAASAPAPKGS